MIVLNLRFWIISISVVLVFVCPFFGQNNRTVTTLHHTNSGFKNNYLPEEKMSKSLGTVFKWRFTRNSQRKVNFELIEPDLDFLNSNRVEETLTWIGHSTFLWQFDGTNLITDPHLTDRASPVSFAGPKRIMKASISLDDLPDLDVVLISHNHYDHLDKKTVLEISEKQKKNQPLFLVPLGMKDWFDGIGIKEKVVELDWWETYNVGNWKYHAVPVQHWSRRGLLDTNKA